MKSAYFNTMLFYASLFITCVFDISSSQMIKKLDLEEGDVCRKSSGFGMDYVCTRAIKCKYFMESIMSRNYLDICSFEGLHPIVCCPSLTLKELSTEAKSTVKYSNLANEKCHVYSKLVYEKSSRYGQKRIVRSTNQNIRMKIIDETVDDTEMLIPFATHNAVAKPHEFPHMAIVGYGETIIQVKWGCGGSLISERWILTAAHCRKMSSMGVARWVRLGELNIISTTDDAQPKDYRIVHRVSHPDYRPPSLYNDVALFRLETDVEFSEYIRPICLNSDPSFNPAVLIATGWGKTSNTGSISADLLKVELNMIPVERCNNSYFSFNNHQLAFGIVPDSMICAGSVDGKKDTCGGDSGGPLQIKNTSYLGMFTQVGITSFGKFCGDKDTPGVYTRVSKYISWIEEIVWPNNNYK